MFLNCWRPLHLEWWTKKHPLLLAKKYTQKRVTYIYTEIIRPSFFLLFSRVLVYSTPGDNKIIQYQSKGRSAHLGIQHSPIVCEHCRQSLLVILLLLCYMLLPTTDYLQHFLLLEVWSTSNSKKLVHKNIECTVVLEGIHDICCPSSVSTRQNRPTIQGTAMHACNRYLPVVALNRHLFLVPPPPLRPRPRPQQQ